MCYCHSILCNSVCTVYVIHLGKKNRLDSNSCIVFNILSITVSLKGLQTVNQIMSVSSQLSVCFASADRKSVP